MTEVQSKYPPFSLEEIISSFRTSSGSLLSQALYLRGIGISKGIPEESIPMLSLYSYSSLSQESKRKMRFEMAQSHRNNSAAKEIIKTARQYYPSQDENFVDNMFEDNFPTLEGFSRLSERIKNSKTTNDEVVKTLKRIFGSNLSQEDVEAKVKYLSAYLNLFKSEGRDDKLVWWNNLSTEEKNIYAEKGHNLLIEE